MVPLVKPVILCGGSGTRLWPLSTQEKPKQFQSLTDQKSMIRLTADRLSGADTSVHFDKPQIIGSVRHQDLLQASLPDADFVLEPMGRNSAPAIAAACLINEPDASLLVLPADHHITDVAAFHKAIVTGCEAASRGDIVTFGITPTHPATGYGYIRAESAIDGICAVQAFVEKPDCDTAKAYLETGSYYWNAGIFLFRVDAMLAAFEAHAPDIVPAVKAALDGQRGAVKQLDAGKFQQAPNISIDYAIMEKAQRISLIPADIGWSDVGGFDALRELKDAAQERASQGPVIAENTQGCYIRSEGPTLAVSGVADLVIVATPKTVLVAPMANDDAVKRLGAAAQRQPLSLSISSETQSRAQRLLQGVFDHWMDCAWDADRGGFVESLDFQGRPNSDLPRRIRVQARQVFSFAEAHRLNFDRSGRAAELASKGLDFLSTKGRHTDGGWAHIIDAEANIINPARGLYDHAFIMMAGAAAWRALGSELARDLAEQARDFIDQELKDHALGGYADRLHVAAARRANPHMHLLEAFLEWHQATNDQAWLDRATEIVYLFEERLFVGRDNMLREHFTSHWQPAPDESGGVFEPGHHYEWASLLSDHDKRTGHDSSSWQHRLIRKADAHGRDPSSGFAHNEVYRDGRITNANRRLWPQLEAFRARLWHPETAPPGTADAFLEAIEGIYFSDLEPGLWMDETDAVGQALAEAVPASMIYHMVTAFRDILPQTEPA